MTDSSVQTADKGNITTARQYRKCIYFFRFLGTANGTESSRSVKVEYCHLRSR